MSGKTITRDTLSKAVCEGADAAHVNCTIEQARHLLDETLRHISDALAAGEDVKIASFGTFRVRDKAARMGRNVKTGESVPIAPRRVVTFKPSETTRDRIKRGNRAG